MRIISIKNKLGFWLGAVLFLVINFLSPPPGLSSEAQRAAAVVVLMAVWWITEAVEMVATSLIPLVLYPVFSIMSMEETAKRYADPLIFLFMGGFMIALAMQKVRLDKRIALHLIRLLGQSYRRILAGFMLAAAFISLWVSNTTAALMVLPIAVAVIDRLGHHKGKHGFNTALMLGIAYASSIGGVATLIGKPANMIFVGQAKTLFPNLAEVNLLQWSLFGFPVALGFLLVTWFFLAFVLIRNNEKDPSFKNVISTEIADLGILSTEEKRVLAIFFITVIAWIWRADIQIGNFMIPGWSTLFGIKGVHDGTVAMAGVLALFVTPKSRDSSERLLNWEWAKRIPWDILLLIGGGFALAESFQRTGLASWIAEGFSVFQGVPDFWLVLFLCLVTTFLSELMSNTAQVAMMMPILAAASGPFGIHPYLLMIPATIASSFAFMMPIGTPPNAIVFGSGHIKLSEMVKAGFVLNILGSLWITFMVYFLLRPIFGIQSLK